MDEMTAKEALQAYLDAKRDRMGHPEAIQSAWMRYTALFEAEMRERSQNDGESL